MVSSGALRAPPRCYSPSFDHLVRPIPELMDADILGVFQLDDMIDAFPDHGTCKANRVLFRQSCNVRL